MNLPERIPLPLNGLQTPIVKQSTSFSCGSAATLALLRYWRWEAYEGIEEKALHAALGTTSDRGTEPEPITAYLRDHAHLEAVYRHGDVTLAELERAVDAGHPPMVDLQAWRDTDTPYRQTWDAGHYVLLVGYDSQHLFVMDPSVLTTGEYAFLPRAELDERWHDLAGDDDKELERMVIFARGASSRPMPRGARPPMATRLG